MKKRRIQFLMLLALVYFGAYSHLEAEEDSIHFVESYAGPHKPEFNNLMIQVKATVPGALAFITEEWRLPNTLHHPLLVMITDNASTIPGRPIAAFVRTVQAGDQLRQELVVDLTHHLMYPGENIDNILYHEMAHVIIQDAVVSPASVGIPQWFNEGLAQSVTTEGHERTEDAYKQWAHTDAPEVLCDLNGNIDAFYHGEYNFGCYTQYYLAVSRLIALGGKDTVVKLINGLHQGIPLPILIQQVTGLNWTAFQSNVAAYTHDVMNEKEPIP